ncbi:MAG: energy-coupling factor transporter ATPase [Firmicutes bacterium]|nr:energy-coupling factor transporter ATPase [Bacillota bacterium]
MGTIIELKNVTYDYLTGNKPFRALDGISFQIKKGEYLALIGPNGSGKSSLARHLNALLVPTSGEVWVDGLHTAQEEHHWEIRRRVGMVFQNPDNQIVATTVEEDVAFGLENIGVETEQIGPRVRAALEQVGLWHFRQHAPHLLSGGQKQRLAIAGVLAMLPQCLVLDEPTAMLDPRGRSEVMATIWQMNRRMGITVVQITHYLEEILEADRVLVMDRGRIVRSGKPQEIFTGDIELEQFGLEIPTIPKLIRLLRTGGLKISPQALNVHDLVDSLEESHPS